MLFSEPRKKYVALEKHSQFLLMLFSAMEEICGLEKAREVSSNAFFSAIEEICGLEKALEVSCNAFFGATEEICVLGKALEVCSNAFFRATEEICGLVKALEVSFKCFVQSRRRNLWPWKSTGSFVLMLFSEPWRKFVAL